MSNANPLTRQPAYFRPRRLAHANIFVSDYEKLFDFYHRIAGFEEVYRQPDNRASFISNGNTYHDMALTDVQSKYAAEGQKPGLFHIAFEVENEVELVEGYQRAVGNGVHFDTTEDHDVAHSLYQTDPDGNGTELYADVVEDWRTARNGVFSKKKPKWIPGVTTPPLEQRCFPVAPEIRVVKDAVFHPRRVSHVAFVAKDFEAMFDYYTGVLGLNPIVGNRSGEHAVLAGTFSEGDVTLFRKTPGREIGMHHIGIEVLNESDLESSLLDLLKTDVAVVREVDHPARRAVVIADPDGQLLQFYVNRDWHSVQLANLSPEDALYLL